METEKVFIGKISNNTLVYIEYYKYGEPPGICFKRNDEQFELNPLEYKEFVNLINNYKEKP